IQCDAEYVKQKTINDYNVPEDKITVFPWGIDLELFKTKNKISCKEQLHIEPEKFVIIFNRYLEPVYGIMYLLEGFKKFCKDKDDVVLLLLSDGSLKDKVKKFIISNQLDKKIKFVGKVSNHELPLYLGASDIFVSTSLSDGTSLSLLEAMACGLGLIVTDLPAIREWVSDQNGFIIPQQNSDAVSDVLEKCYNNINLTEKKGKINIKIANERADWSKNYLKLKQIYNKISKS
ncbi:MAG: glycosyltransferase, partial [Ignavibacteria bacterium]